MVLKPVAATMHVHERCRVTVAMKYMMSGTLLEEAGTTSTIELIDTISVNRIVTVNEIFSPKNKVLH